MKPLEILLPFAGLCLVAGSNGKRCVRLRIFWATWSHPYQISQNKATWQYPDSTVHHRTEAILGISYRGCLEKVVLFLYFKKWSNTGLWGAHKGCADNEPLRKTIFYLVYVTSREIVCNTTGSPSSQVSVLVHTLRKSRNIRKNDYIPEPKKVRRSMNKDKPTVLQTSQFSLVPVSFQGLEDLLQFRMFLALNPLNIFSHKVNTCRYHKCNNESQT